MEYKTLRYPGHVAIMRPIRELGLLDNKPIEVKGQPVVPRDLFIAAVSPSCTSRRAGTWSRSRCMVTGHEGRAGPRGDVPADRLLRRRARHQRHDADHGVLALDHRPDAGRRPGHGEGRAHAGRGDAVPRPTSTSWPARDPDRGTLAPAGDVTPSALIAWMFMPDFRALWDQALPFDAFVAASTEHRGCGRGSTASPGCRSGPRAPAAPATRALLVIAEDWCGDASNTVPVVARSPTRCRGSSSRVLRRDEHPEVMDRYLTNGSAPSRSSSCWTRSSASWGTGARGRPSCRPG